MKQETLFKKIGSILDELNDQYQFLAQNIQDLSELELELLLANASFLEDHIQILNKIVVNQSKNNIKNEVEVSVNQHTINTDTQIEQRVSPLHVENFNESKIILQQNENEEVKPVVEDIKEEIFKLDHTSSTFEFILNDHSEHKTIEDLPQIKNDPLIRDSFITNENKFNKDEKSEFEDKRIDENYDEPLKNEEEHILPEKKDLTSETIVEEEEEEVGPEPFLVTKQKEILPVIEEDLKLELPPVPKPIEQSDNLVLDPTNKPSLNDLLASKLKPNNAHLDKPAIKDLKQAVSLNDKLLYIKDLFNGYNLAYTEAIEIANKLPNFEAADNFFQMNYAKNNNWAKKQDTVDKFYQLLNQRFK